MATQDWGLLPQPDEDALHNVARLLLVESRPILRIFDRIAKSNTFDNVRPMQLPSPPPDASAVDEEAAARAATRAEQTARIEDWKDAIINEIGLLEFTLLRSELTVASNEVERARYAEAKIATKQKQDHVRENIEKLRLDLVQARETLATRKIYDELTEKITNSKMLKPRDEQALAHAKLDEEIAELEHEVQTAKDTWNERRMQFYRIEEEAKQMLRMIKDEKEEAERKEGMMKEDDEVDGDTARGDVSHIGTPRPDGSMTPLPAGQTTEAQSNLKVPQDRLAPLLQSASRAPSPARSGIAEDVEMAEAVNGKADDSSGVEEGEDLEDGEDDGQLSERAESSAMDES